MDFICRYFPFLPLRRCCFSPLLCCLPFPSGQSYCLLKANMLRCNQSLFFILPWSDVNRAHNRALDLSGAYSQVTCIHTLLQTVCVRQDNPMDKLFGREGSIGWGTFKNLTTSAFFGGGVVVNCKPVARQGKPQPASYSTTEFGDAVI